MGLKVFVSLQEGHSLAHKLVGGGGTPSHAGVGVGAEAEVERLGCHHGFEGEDAGCVGDYGAGVAGGDWAHADVVFDVGGGGNGVDAGGMGEAFVLGG